MNKNYTYSTETGQIECQDLMGLLQLLSESDKNSLKYFHRLEKVMFENSKKLRREDVKTFMFGNDESPGMITMYPPNRPLSEVTDLACSICLTRLVTTVSSSNSLQFASK